VKGSGSLEGCAKVKGSIVVSNASVYSDANRSYNGSNHNGIECLKLTITGGSLSAKGSDSFPRGVGVTCKSAFISNGNLTSTGSNGIVCSDVFSVSGGTVRAMGIDGQYEGIICANATISGGNVIAEGNIGIECSGNLTITNGNVTASSKNGVSIREVGISCCNLTISGGAVNAKGGKGWSSPAIDCDNMTIKSGSVTTSGARGIECSNLYVSGGSVNIPNANSGIEVGDYGSTKAYMFSMTGGMVKVSNPSNCGIRIRSGNLEMRGGTLAVTGSYGSGIDVDHYTYRGTTYGGKVKVSGGSLTSTTRKASSSAIRANSMSNKATTLKSIYGTLPKGASFVAGANQYKVPDDHSSTATLVKYNSKSTKPKLKSVKYGGNVYSINAVASNAFNTKNGKKVKSLVLGYLDNLAAKALYGMKSLKTLKINWINLYGRNGQYGHIGANAFSGTKSLTKLSVSLSINAQYSKNKLKSLKFLKGYKISKSAFKNAGKSSGAKLTVTLNSGIRKQDAKTYSKFLSKYGLSKKAKLKTRG